MALFGSGTRHTLRGLRTGDQRWLYFGLALLAFRYLRRPPRRRRLYRQVLEPGIGVAVRMPTPGQVLLKLSREGDQSL
jgi:hypothetical protein